MEAEKMIRRSAALLEAGRHCWSGILGGRKTVSAQVCLALEQGQQWSVARMEEFCR